MGRHLPPWSRENMLGSHGRRMFRKIQLHTVDTAALAKEEFELLVALIGTSGAYRSMKLL